MGGAEGGAEGGDMGWGMWSGLVPVFLWAESLSSVGSLWWGTSFFLLDTSGVGSILLNNLIGTSGMKDFLGPESEILFIGGSATLLDFTPNICFNLLVRDLSFSASP